MPKLLSTTMQNFSARVTSCPQFVHTCKYALYIEEAVWCSWHFNWSQLIKKYPDSNVQTSSIHCSLFTDEILHSGKHTLSVCFKLWLSGLWHCTIGYEVTGGTVYVDLQNSCDGFIFHKSTVRLKKLYLSLSSVRQFKPWWGQDFQHVLTSPKAHPTSCTMPTVSVLGVKWLGCDNYHPPPSSTDLVNTMLYVCSPPCFHGML
jgi:hypothetical protein